MNKYFLLYANCIPVKGYKKAIICDLQLSKYIEIPLELFEILEVNKKEFFTISELMFFYQNKYDKGIEKYIQYLCEIQYGFCDDSKECYLPINLEFKIQAMVSNAIIELSEYNTEYYERIIDQLTLVNCLALEIWILNETGLKVFYDSISILQKSSIKSIDVYINGFQCSFTSIDFNFAKFRLGNVVVYNAPIGKLENNIYFTRNNMNSKSCGNVFLNEFVLNIKSFTESLHHNSCLNRKISIDTEGNIKNCPSMKESFGNIKDTTLAEAIEKPGFKKYWNINKDQIAVCKDCEFRYICTDCRAYVEDPQDTSGPEGTNLSKPLKCGYNPYTGEWAEWTTNPLKQKAIDFYGMREMVEVINISENKSNDMNI